jgi:hypothetical protein
MPASGTAHAATPRQSASTISPRVAVDPLPRISIGSGGTTAASAAAISSSRACTAEESH